MNSRKFNQSFLQHRPIVTLAMKCKQQEAIDQQVADYLAKGGQIHRFDLISRDINGVKFNPDNRKQG